MNGVKHTHEYTVVSANTDVDLIKKLNEAAKQGFRPILMSSAASGSGAVVISTVVLEHELPPRNL